MASATRERRRRALPELQHQVKSAAKALYDVTDELKKRPVLRRAVNSIAQGLEDTADDGWQYGLERADDLEGMEQLAREEVAAVAREHVVRLPGKSKIRAKLIDISGLDHAERVADYDARVAEVSDAPENEATVPAAKTPPTPPTAAAIRERLEATTGINPPVFGVRDHVLAQLRGIAESLGVWADAFPGERSVETEAALEEADETKVLIKALVELNALEAGVDQAGDC